MCLSRFPAVFLLTGLLTGLLTVACGPAWADDNALPDDAAQALHAATNGQLYSLEPWAMPGGPSDRLHDRAVLGDTELNRKDAHEVAEAIGAAVAGWDGIKVGCFDPRQAFRVQSGRVTYDFLLSYQCHALEVYKNGAIDARLGMFGDPRALNDLLTAEKIPLSRSGQ